MSRSQAEEEAIYSILTKHLEKQGVEGCTVIASTYGISIHKTAMACYARDIRAQWWSIRDSVILEYYERLGTEFCAAMIIRRGGRAISPKSIKIHAKRLGVKSCPSVRWSKNENNIVRKYWPDKTKITHILAQRGRYVFPELLDLRAKKLLLEK